jgi:transposase
MPVHSQDLRKRVIDALGQPDGSFRKVATRFQVSLSFITRLVQLRRLTGSTEPRPHGGGRPPALGPADLERLRELIRERPDATLEELRRALGVACGLMAVSRAVRGELKITRKKKDRHARERDSPEVERKREEFREEVARLDPRRLVFVDETGANTAMARTYGRAPVGERVHGAAPGHWESVTLICGMRLSGVTAPMILEGATDAAAFEAYVERALAPQLRRGDVVIWDDLKPHQARAAVEAVERAGASVVPLPPWSPDLSPIEEMFSKLKGALRSAAARTKETVYAAIGAALHDVSPQDISGWFKSRASYSIQS